MGRRRQCGLLPSQRPIDRRAREPCRSTPMSTPGRQRLASLIGRERPDRRSLSGCGYGDVGQLRRDLRRRAQRQDQLMALAFASRFRTWPVLIGMTVATVLSTRSPSSWALRSGQRSRRVSSHSSPGWRSSAQSAADRLASRLATTADPYRPIGQALPAGGLDGAGAGSGISGLHFACNGRHVGP